MSQISIRKTLITGTIVAALASSVSGVASAQTFEETVSFILRGNKHSNKIKVIDSKNCIVQDVGRSSTIYFNKVNPTTISVKTKRRTQNICKLCTRPKFETTTWKTIVFLGDDYIKESAYQMLGKSEIRRTKEKTFSITVVNESPERRIAAIRHLYAKYCPGKKSAF